MDSQQKVTYLTRKTTCSNRKYDIIDLNKWFIQYILLQLPLFINMNNIFIWIGNPNPCLLRFRVVAGAFFLFKTHLFGKGVFCGLPKPCLLRFRLAAGASFFEKRHAFLKKCVFCQELIIFINVPTYRMVLRTARYCAGYSSFDKAIQPKGGTTGE